MRDENEMCSTKAHGGSTVITNKNNTRIPNKPASEGRIPPSLAPFGGKPSPKAAQLQVLSRGISPRFVRASDIHRILRYRVGPCAHVDLLVMDSLRLSLPQEEHAFSSKLRCEMKEFSVSKDDILKLVDLVHVHFVPVSVATEQSQSPTLAISPSSTLEEEDSFVFFGKAESH